MTTRTAYMWRGRDRRGTPRAGRLLTSDLADEVQARFTRGWRCLTVFLGEDQVAAIGPHPDTGKRIWWAARNRPDQPEPEEG